MQLKIQKKKKAMVSKTTKEFQNTSKTEFNLTISRRENKRTERLRKCLIQKIIMCWRGIITFEIGDGIDIRDDHCDMGIEAGVDENCIVRWVRMGIGG